MKNPSPEEFGLTQRDIEHYLKQKELFDNEYKKHLATNEILSFFITWIISTIIVFVITLLVDPTIFKEKAWSLFVLPIGAFFFPGLFLIAISDGSYRFLDREKEIKARFFSADLEHRYQSYTKAVAEYNHYLEQNNRNYWIQMNGFQFEKEVASLFRNYGYDATVTSATADGGVDIILKKNGERIAVQCKHHAKPVGPNDVRALQGVVASQNYSKGIFVSLNGYTSSVHYEVRRGSVKIELLELKDILQMAKGDCKQPTIPPLPTSDLEKQLIIQLYQSLDDESINMLSGKTVSHTKFGNGIITFITERKYIEVYFPDIEEEKKFVFPNAFADNYIVPVDFRIVQKK